MSANIGGVLALIGSAAAGLAAATATSQAGKQLAEVFVDRIFGTRVSGEKPPEPTLEHRLEELSRLMADSAKLLALVTTEMELRRNEVERLQHDQQQAEATRSLTEEQLDAIRDQLVAAVRPETDRGIRWAILIGILGFLAGALAALAVALFVHPFH